MEKIAIIADNQSSRVKFLKETLGPKVKYFEAHDFDAAMALLKASFNEIEALIIDNPSGKDMVN